MPGTWKRPLIFVVMLLVFTPCRAASAFHAGSTFDKPPGAGGGGGIFYTGSPRVRGWGCGMCHVNASGKLKIGFTSDPAALFESLEYVPGQTYRLTVSLLNERLGLRASLSNYNTMAISSVSAEGQLVGRFSGYAAEDYYARGESILAASGTTPNQTRWAFDWTAPEAGRGTVGLYLGLVDGNGADSGATETLTDPFGDDVLMGRIQLQEQGAEMALGAEMTQRARQRPTAAAAGGANWGGMTWSLLGLLLAHVLPTRQLRARL